MKSFLYAYCTACFRAHDLAPAATTHGSVLVLCGGCRDELDELAGSGRRSARSHTLASGLRITSLYAYRDLVRDLVLRAKVQSDHLALRLLVSLAATHSAAAPVLRRSDVLIASPSSLWGRLRGRFDLAHGLTTAFAAAHRKPVACAPYELFWRWSKRARQASRHHRRPLQPAAFPPWLLARMQAHWLARYGETCGARRVILIDDVVTTGSTVEQLAKALGGLIPAETIEVLALASAMT
jgi:predicted amidophosphoribosyltransferase